MGVDVTAYRRSYSMRQETYRPVSQNPKNGVVQMSESIGLSSRWVQNCLKRIKELGKMTRVGGRKMGEWRISDEEHEDSLKEYDM